MLDLVDQLDESDLVKFIEALMSALLLHGRNLLHLKLDLVLDGPLDILKDTQESVLVHGESVAL